MDGTWIVWCNHFHGKFNKKCLQRQVSEWVNISNSKADYLMNSKTEFMQPSVSRVVSTRQVRDHGS